VGTPATGAERACPSAGGRHGNRSRRGRDGRHRRSVIPRGRAQVKEF
jgi:hypothetical protein